MEYGKLTNATTETSFGNLLQSAYVFSIPYFQRGFKWKEKDRKLLIEDINQILNEEEDLHFLGTIITYKKLTGATEYNIFEIIDGQQRIITLYLHILAIVDIFIKNKHFPDAVVLFQNLVLPGKTNHPSNFKLYTSRHDRKQFNTVINRIFNNKGFKKEYGSFDLKLLPEAGTKTGSISKMYSKVKSSINQYYNEAGGKHKLDQILDVIFERLHFIEIMLNDASNSTKFFERVNSRGITVTTGELVRNEVFSRVIGQDDAIVNKIHEESWIPFYDKFKDSNQFDEFLFAFTLLQDSTFTKQRTFEYLRSRWKGFDEPDAIIEDLKSYQDIYLQIKYDRNGNLPVNIIQLPKKTYNYVLSYVRSNTPTTVLPFIMRLLFEYKNNDLDVKVVNKMFLAIDSYLTRRAVLGIEPTGLHAIFKGLWKKLPKVTVENTVKVIKETKTMNWPTDEEFEYEIINKNLYSSRICQYLVYEYNRDLGGDVPTGKFEIEHILPKDYRNWWKDDFTKEEHFEYVNKLANLIAVSPELNKKAFNLAYDKKKEVYIGSKFTSARDLIEKYEKWNPKTLEERSKELVKWAKIRWPY